MEIPTPACALVRNDNVVRCLDFPLQIPNLRTTERYRAGQGIYDYANEVHDLAVGPADKFQFICLLGKADIYLRII